MALPLLMALVCWMIFPVKTLADSPWQEAAQLYASSNYPGAAAIYQSMSSNQVASANLLQNWGNAEWQSARKGPAILAWEKAFWLDPHQPNVRNNLRFARRTLLLEEPEMGWYEFCSTWLPANDWAVLSASSFWVMLGLILLPGLFGWKKSVWLQAGAAGALSIFILTLPALYGLHTRSRMAVVLTQNGNLLLTPTAAGQVKSQLPEGEMVRLIRRRGAFSYVRTTTQNGWIQGNKLGFISE